MVPAQWEQPLARAMPPIEAALGASLVTGVRVQQAAWLSGAVMLVFAGAMQSALSRGIVTDCGCFGSLSRSRVSGKIVARDVLLAAAAVHLAMTSPTSSRRWS